MSRKIVAAGQGFVIEAYGERTTITRDHTPAYVEPQPEKRSPTPSMAQWYKPVESPTRWPLELRVYDEGVKVGRVEIGLWSEGGEHSWLIAYWIINSDGADLKFVGNRPLDPRVNWSHFRELVATGQKIADQISTELSNGDRE